MHTLGEAFNQRSWLTTFLFLSPSLSLCSSPCALRDYMIAHVRDGLGWARLGWWSIRVLQYARATWIIQSRRHSQQIADSRQMKIARLGVPGRFRRGGTSQTLTSLLLCRKETLNFRFRRKVCHSRCRSRSFNFFSNFFYFDNFKFRNF